MEKAPGVGTLLAAIVLSAAAQGVSAAGAAAPLTPARLSIASPSSGSLVGGQVQVAVAFDAGQYGKVTALELWINDRFYAATQIDSAGPRGTFNLDLDTLRLQNGQHSLKVRALYGRKVISTDTAVVTVTNGGVDIVPPLVSFNAPMDGDTLSGIATIDVNAADNDRVALVSLFVNKLPMMLKSLPPYSYQLDTTTLPLKDGRGSLLLEALAYDRAQNVGKAKPIRVYVNNPVNATPMQPDPPAVPPSGETRTSTPATARAAARPPAPVPSASAAPVPAPSGARLSTPPASRPATSAVAMHPRVSGAPALPPAAAPSSLRALAGARSVAPPSSRPVRSTPTVDATAPRENASLVLPLGPPIRVAGSPAPGTRVAPPAATRPAPVKLPESVVPRRTLAKATAPELRAVPRATVSPAVVPTPQPAPASPRVSLPVYIVRPVPETLARSRSYLVARGDRLSEIARRHGVTPQSILVANGLRDATELRAGSRLVVPGTFQVAMNGEPIGFDVNPRVERGLPITPFRQIFEHAGGAVVYYPDDHSVMARKTDREVQLKIGSKQASVNQVLVIMDRAAFIDSGRTMVPMRFMAEALDMKAEYDPKTGTVYLKHKEGKIASLPAAK